MTPSQALSLVLDEEHATAIVDHRKAMKKPLTEFAAKLLAKEFAKCPAPNEAAEQMLAQVLGSEEAARQLLGMASGLPGVFNAAASAAAGIAAELDRAVAAAGRLANAGVGDLQTARINAQFRTDPVGRAGALAGARFDADVGNLGAVPNDQRQVLQEQRQEYIENAKANPKGKSSNKNTKKAEIIKMKARLLKMGLAQ